MPGRAANTTISVVVPCYNRQETIARAVESVLAQRRPPIEVIVVDDGSTDSTCETVRGIRGVVQYVYQANAGVSSARNRGVELAKGEWVAFLDSDDFWYPEHLARIEDAILGTGGRASLYFANWSLSGEIDVWTCAHFGISRDYELAEDASAWVMQAMQPMMWSAVVVRRRDYIELGGLWEALRVREDTHFYFKLGLERPVCAVRGCGGEATKDGDPGGRLSIALGSKTADYWQATAWLYEDILRREGPNSRAAGRELKRRAAQAHRQLAIRSAKDGRWFRAFGHLVRAGCRDPQRMVVAGLKLPFGRS